jgi:O86/O127-antigen biosynthesis beta-1,3-galactosyltransferase
MNKMIKYLSVVMPTYNCGEHIYYAINSILKQSFKDYEFIIIDDGSTDNTEEIVNSFNDTRIKYFKLEHKGFIESANFGVSVASSQWIARMDADDIAVPERFEKQIDYLNKDKEQKFVSCWYSIFSGTINSYIVRTPVNHDDILKQLPLHSVICHPGVIFNKQDFNLANGYIQNTREDYDLWLRMKDCVTFYNYPEVLMFIRKRKNSLSRNSFISNSILLKISQNKYPDLKNDFGIEDPLRIQIILGWREWFYGNPIVAREIWKEVGISRLSFNEIAAYLISFLPQSLFIKFKEGNLKLRLTYLFKESIKYKKRLNRQLKELIILN